MSREERMMTVSRWLGRVGLFSACTVVFLAIREHNADAAIMGVGMTITSLGQVVYDEWRARRARGAR